MEVERACWGGCYCDAYVLLFEHADHGQLEFILMRDLFIICEYMWAVRCNSHDHNAYRWICLAGTALCPHSLRLPLASNPRMRGDKIEIYIRNV